MKDESVFGQLNDYVDGVLPGPERADLERRLQTDPALRAEVDAIRSIVGRARELPRSVDPARDLWPAIESRLAAGGARDTGTGRDTGPGRDAARQAGTRVIEGNFGGWGRRVLGIAALLAIFAAGLVTGVLNDRGERTRVADAPEAVRPEDVVRVPVELSRLTEDERALDAEYAAAAEELFRRLDANDPELDAETVETIRLNLDIIDEAVREIRAALEGDPENARLEHMLNEGYRKRSGVLRRAADLREAI